MSTDYSGDYPGSKPGGNSRRCSGPEAYRRALEILDGACLAVLALILSWSMFTVSSDLGGKTWAYGSALFADLAFIFTLYSVFTTNGWWLSTSLLACLFGNCVFWSLNYERAVGNCSSTGMAWACQGAMEYVFYSLMVASGILQFLYWHLKFDPHASSAGSGYPPCWGPRRSDNNRTGMGGSGGGGGGGGNLDNQNGLGNGYELGREYTRRTKRSRRRRLADVEAFGSSDQDGPHGLARSQSAGYKSLGRRGSRSSRRLSSDSLDQL